VSLIQILLVNHESVKMPSALINIVTLCTVMYIRNYKRHLNIAESTSLQNVNLAEFILAFLEGPLKYAKLAPRENNPAIRYVVDWSCYRNIYTAELCYS
jgi:hypothetical protein